MSKAKIIFHKCVQDSQDYGSDDEHMVFRVFFNLEIGKERFFSFILFFKRNYSPNNLFNTILGL